MLWILVKRSFLFHLISMRFAAGFLAVVTLVAVTAALDRRDYEKRLAEYEKTTELHGKWLGAARTYVELVPCLDRKPNPLSSIASGIEGLFGSTIVIPGWYSTISIISSSTSTNPFLHSIARTDLSYLVAVVVTLLAVFMTFDSVSGERERGTLKLQRSMSVPEHVFLGAQYLGALICVAISICAAFVVWFVVFGRGEIQLTGAQWQSVIGVFILSILLLSVFILLGILLSSRMRNSAQSLVALMFVWAVVVVVSPNLFGQLSSALQPSPMQMPRDTERWELGAVPSQEAPPAKGKNLLVGGVFYPMEVYGEQFLEGLYDASAYNTMLAQYETYWHMSFLSPVALYLAAVPEVVATGPMAYARYVDASLRYQDSLRQWQEAKVKVSPHRSMWFADGDGPIDKAGLPVPSVYADDGSALSKSFLLPAAGMAVWNLLLVAALARVSLLELGDRRRRGSVARWSDWLRAIRSSGR